jgi:hypothetical protein
MEKDDLLENLENEREKFLDAIEGLSDEELAREGVVGDWSIKDIMAHLSAWEAELIKLLWQAKQVQKPTSIHFSEVPVDEVNQTWYQASKTRPLERILADYQSVRKQTERRVQAFSKRLLNDPQAYPWLRGRPLWEWIANDSYLHEAEHREQIQTWREQLNKVSP